MNIIFKIQASSQIGSGHLVRCINLAKAISIHSIESKISFILNGDNKYLNEIKSRGFSCFMCPTRNNDNQLINAEDTINIIINNKLNPDLIVIDDYSIDQTWENILYKHTDKILVIDDLANRKHSCDILIDQNMYELQKEKYIKLISNKTKLLLGPSYAILHEDYKNFLGKTLPRSNDIKKVMLSFGGTDDKNVTEAILKEIVSKSSYNGINFNVVITDNFKFQKSVLSYEKYNNIYFHKNLESLASLMQESDICIGACGTSTWERFAMGLPAMVLTVADNQVEIAKYLHQNNLINYIGNITGPICTLTKSLLTEIENNIFYNDTNNSSSKKILELVDGKGSIRIVNEIFKILK